MSNIYPSFHKTLGYNNVHPDIAKRLAKSDLVKPFFKLKMDVIFQRLRPSALLLIDYYNYICKHLRKYKRKCLHMNHLRSPQFGAILFRATELIGQQGANVFDSLGFQVPASQISIVLALSKYGPSSSTELSNRIGISRQLIESRLKKSVNAGIFVVLQDENDSRKRLYDFAEDIRKEAKRIVNIMLDFERVYDSLWQEIGVDIEQGLLLMEKALKKASLEERLVAQFPKYLNQLQDR